MAYSFTQASAQNITGTLTAAVGFPITLAARIQGPSAVDNRGIRLSAGSGSANYISLDGTDLARAVAVSRSAGASFMTGYGSAYSANTWSSLVGVFATNTSRVCWLNGTNGTANTSTTDSATFDAVLLGSAGGSGIPIIADAAIWSVALSSDEIASLNKGFKPFRIRPQSLIFYAPLIRNLQDVDRGITLTNNNGVPVANHPRVY